MTSISGNLPRISGGITRKFAYIMSRLPNLLGLITAITPNISIVEPYIVTLHTNLKKSNATTQFTNFKFNSFCNFNGFTLGAGINGIESLEGDTDNGEFINGYFEPVLSNFGDIHSKHIRFLYVSYKSNGPVKIEIISDAIKDSSILGALNLPCNSKTEQQRYRQPVPKKIQGEYWAFRYLNVNGSDFSIDSVYCLYVARNLGVPSDT